MPIKMNPNRCRKSKITFTAEILWHYVRINLYEQTKREDFKDTLNDILMIISLICFFAGENDYLKYAWKGQLRMN